MWVLGSQKCFLASFSKEVCFTCQVIVNKQLPSAKVRKWVICKDCPPESHVSMSIREMSLDQWNFNSLMYQNGYIKLMGLMAVLPNDASLPHLLPRGKVPLCNPGWP